MINYDDMSDFEIEVEVTRILFPFVLDDGYEFLGSRDGFLYTNEDRKEHKLSGNKLICTIKNYCNNALDAWPIIVENKIATEWYHADLWRAQCDNQFKAGPFMVFTSYCHNPLRAAMICFLKMKDAEND